MATAESAVVGGAVDYSDGSMVCLYLDPGTASGIAVEGGQPPDTLHITLAFLPEGVDEPETVAARLFEMAQWFYPLAGEIGGLGMFAEGPDGVPVIALPDVPGLPELRVAVTEVLEEAGVVVADNHGFLPHITLSYGDTTVDPDILHTPIQFAEVTLVVGAERWDLPLGATAVTAADNYPDGDNYPEELGGHPRGWGLGPAYRFKEDQIVGRPGGVAQVPRRPFEEALHPRAPAGTSRGGQFVAKLGLTPFRPGDNPRGFYESEKYIAFTRSLGETAARHDVTIDAQDKVQGFWQGEQEPSLALDVHDGEDGVRMFAEDLRDQWDQDAILVFQPDRDGDDLVYRARAVGDIPRALTEAGIDGATIYREGFEVYGGADEAAKVIAVADKLGIPHSEIQVRAGRLSFASRPDPVH